MKYLWQVWCDNSRVIGEGDDLWLLTRDGWLYIDIEDDDLKDLISGVGGYKALWRKYKCDWRETAW